MCSDRVRVAPWIIPDPSAFVQHEYIVVCINHGGANSFLEAVVTGKPQIILPAWIDCFDFANRAEMLGIGLWGNKRVAGGYIHEADLSAALVEILAGSRAEEIRSNAKGMAAL